MAELNIADSEQRRRKPFRLSPGPYEQGDRPLSRSMAQSAFVHRVNQILPEVFQTLHQQVYPAFKMHPDRNDSQWRYFEAFEQRDPDKLP